MPDFMTTAKGLTSGYVPMGAVFMADHVYQTIADGAGASAVGHGYTYSAHPVSAAVGLEVLRLYEGGLLENGRKAGARLMEGLAEPQGPSARRRCSRPRNARGRGTRGQQG